jgi:hypothetical protein
MLAKGVRMPTRASAGELRRAHQREASRRAASRRAFTRTFEFSGVSDHGATGRKVRGQERSELSTAPVVRSHSSQSSSDFAQPKWRLRLPGPTSYGNSLKRTAKHARPRTLANHARPRTLANHARPRTLAKHARPRTLANHARPRTLAKHARPRTLAKHARPRTLVNPRETTN